MFPPSANPDLSTIFSRGVNSQFFPEVSRVVSVVKQEEEGIKPES